MKALTLLLCASLANAQPIDAPLADQPAIIVQTGEVLAYDSVCMPGPKAIEVGKRLASAEAQVAAMKGKTVLSTPVLVGGVAALVLVSLAVGAAAAYAATAK